jgi:hypothetical protein
VHAEKLLFSSSDYQAAVFWAIGNVRTKKYRSVLDCVFAETYNEFLTPTFRYYRDEGPQLKDYMPAEEISKYDLALCRMLAVVLILWTRCEGKKKRGEVIDLTGIGSSCLDLN